MSETKTRGELDTEESIEFGSGRSSFNLSLHIPTRLNSEQQQWVRDYMYLSKQTANRIKQKLSAEGYVLSKNIRDEIDSDTELCLVKIASYNQSQQLSRGLLDAFFRKGFEWFINQKVIKIKNKMKKQKVYSLTKSNGNERDFPDRKQEWLDGDIIDYTGCPFAEFVKRIFIDGESIKEVFPTGYDRKLWYTKMLPAIKRHLRDLYDLDTEE